MYVSTAPGKRPMYSPPRDLPAKWEPKRNPSAVATGLSATWNVLVALVYMSWTLIGCVARPVRPALTFKTVRSKASLEGDPGPSGEAPRRSFQVHSMLADWRWIWTELGTVMMLACVAESMYQMGAHSLSRALHLHLALGLSKGLGLLLIWVIIVAQAAAGGALMVPKIYLITGAIPPSAVLASTLWFEALVFGDMADPASAVRSVALTLTATMLALFRFDRQARNAMEQLPTNGTLLAVEAQVRKVCTAIHTGVVLPLLSTGLLGWALWHNAYWRASGMTYEWKRGKFHASVAMAALGFLTAGQDTKAHVLLGDRLERLYDKAMKRKEDLLGHPRASRPLGAKKDF